MKRRGFLGLLGGAAVAGPAAAKSAVTEVLPVSGGSNLINSLTARGYGGESIPPRVNTGPGLFRNFDRALQLKRLIAGEEEQELEPYEVAQVRRVMVEHDINVLRSVSATQKVRIMHRHAAKIERDRQKAYWLKELLGLERETP